MKKGLKAISISSIILMVLYPILLISMLLFSTFWISQILLSLAIAALNILIYIGYLMISTNEDKMLRFSLFSLIAITSISLVFNIFSLSIQFLWIILTLLTAIFTLLFGIGVIKLRRLRPVLPIIIGILLIISSLSLALSSLFYARLGMMVNPFGLSASGFMGYGVSILSLVLFYLFKEGEERNTEEAQKESAGSIGKGYITSLLIALAVAVLGAIFEAFTGIVTITLMPDAVFIIVNTIFLALSKDKNKKIGLGIGYINLGIVIVLSVIVFFLAITVFQSIGWYDLCHRCRFSIG